MTDETDLPVEPLVVGEAVIGPTKIGTAPRLTILIDLNGDGVPDWQQPTQIAKLVEKVLEVVITLVPGGSPIARVLTPIEAVLPVIATALGSIR